MRILLLYIFLFAIAPGLMAQELKPGFQKEEYQEMLQILSITNKPDSNEHLENIYAHLDIEIPAPENYNCIYKSDKIGLENYWELWQHTNKDLAVISIRATTRNPISWMENFYSAMVPAQGEIKLNDTFTFRYKLALNEDAAIHIGWLIGIAFIANEVIPKVYSLREKNINDVLITGHSQGGALAYYLTAILRIMQLEGLIPEEMKIKTYCSASPKPGNLFFAYDYEHITQGSWSFNIVNSKDWVPEVPVSVQTVDDLNTTNPFTDASELINAQKFPRNLILKVITTFAQELKFYSMQKKIITLFFLIRAIMFLLITT